MSWTVDTLDVRVAERLCRLAGVDDPALRTLAALAASAPRGGHVCVDLSLVDGDVVQRAAHGVERAAGTDDEADRRPLAPLGDLQHLLPRATATPLVRDADEADRVTPLVVAGGRVYLDRYWRYEDRLHRQLVERSRRAGPPDDPHRVRAVLDKVSRHDPSGPAVDRQRLAVANGLLRPLSVLSGGPGTGKTHTVVSLLVAHVLMAAEGGAAPPRMAVAAPTGKAAARLEQAISDATRDRDLPRAALDRVARLRGTTIHRLLGFQRRSPTRFRHDPSRPLPHDVVVVDEASMVPLALMAKLVEAVREDATLILVGDRDQLTSVEAGAVLGDVCGPRTTGSTLRLSDGWTEVLTAATGEPVAGARTPMRGPGVWDGIVQLERFRRFGSDTGIGAIAHAIQQVAVDDDVAAAQRVVDLLTGATAEHDRDAAVHGDDEDRPHTDVALLTPVDGTALPAVLEATVVEALRPYVDAVFADDAPAALAAIDRLRPLCAVRAGPHGVGAVGALVERWVARSDDRIDPADEWYVGRPVLVTRNDHDLGVMNGDVGVTMRDGDRLVVAFRLADGDLRRVPAVRVADCETVWAMTIHKSQGSQFDHAVVVLPDRDVDVVTRELLYTGVTRARQRLTVVASPGALHTAVRRAVRRATGLGERLAPD